MKKIYLLMGNFGVGKSSIVNFYEHKPIRKMVLSEVQGFLSLGGARGADDLIKAGYKKPAVFDLLKELSDRDFIIHSCIYQNMQDIDRYTKTHNVEVIFLKTSIQINAERMKMRGKKIDPALWLRFMKYSDKVRQFCQYKRVPFHEIDNDRELSAVCGEVWGLLKLSPTS